MKANTRIFGEIEIADEKIITLEKGMIGFPNLNRFALIYDEEKKQKDTSIMWLQSMDDADIAFPVMIPNAVKEDYDPNVSEEMIARFVAEEMEEDEFRRGKGVTEIEALRERRKIPEHIRRLLLANAFCHNCGTTEFAPGYTLRMRHGCVLIEGCCAKCGAEVARLCD